MNKPHLRLHYRGPCSIHIRGHLWSVELVRPGAGIRVLTGHHYTPRTLAAAGAVQAAQMLWWP